MANRVCTRCARSFVSQRSDKLLCEHCGGSASAHRMEGELIAAKPRARPSQRLTAITTKRPAPAACTHHYVIETPHGNVTVHGVCRRCGSERDFEASITPEVARHAQHLMTSSRDVG